MNKDFYNASGCADPTAYTAIKNVDHDAAGENANRLIKIIKAVIAENGFVLLNRIELKELKSGTIFK
ncbi:hypothetical protein FACS1894208_05400 [Clostridia bacterium]|nr:hypothetical protein FACS1894208_05400 [Clostridia bacterium]